MHDIIEHYGKVIIALAGVLAALLLTAAVVTTISKQLSVESNMKHRSAMLLTRHNIMQLLTCCDVILLHF